MQTLNEYIQKTYPGRNQEYVAGKLGISRSHLCLLLSEKRGPSKKLIEQIHEKTGGAVTPASWFPRISTNQAQDEIVGKSLDGSQGAA